MNLNMLHMHDIVYVTFDCNKVCKREKTQREHTPSEVNLRFYLDVSLKFVS